MDRVNAELETNVLKGVSRSFYLSLRLLPAPMRSATSLAYLLARTSDTIADTASVEAQQRISLLDQFHEAVENESSFTASHELLENCEPKEKILLEKINNIFIWFNSMPAEEKILIKNVLDEIISGQKLDLVRFQNATQHSPVSLADHQELLDYCERVAGSVGEFWTRLGFFTMGKDFSDAEMPLMIREGRAYGCGLQLVNILRDMPEDLQNGRIYISSTADENSRMPEYAKYVRYALTLIENAFLYTEKVKSRRLRAATVLPAMIAEDTLHLLENASWQEITQRIKVKRSTVFHHMLRAWLY